MQQATISLSTRNLAGASAILTVASAVGMMLLRSAKALGSMILTTLVVSVATLCSSPNEARADFDFQFATNLNGGWLRRTPSFTTKELSTSARDIGRSTLPSSRGVGLFGFSSDVDLTLDDRWRVPLIGGQLMWAVGSYDATVTSLDGSIARQRPWSTVRGDLFLPGIGRRWKYRRNMWGIAVRSGVSFTSMGGSVAAGTDTVPLDLTAVTFLIQLEVEACRRLDPTTRVCLQIAPRMYEHEPLNGLTFGIRMEWGR